MATRLCATAGCSRLAEIRGRCREHAAEQRKANRSKLDAFYSSKAWRMSRCRQLFDHPLCQYVDESGQECGAIADSVHHRIELDHGGAPRDPANLMSVCRRHHSTIHARRGRGRVATFSEQRAKSPTGRLRAPVKTTR
jgi:5-methylcytosine-specific restriction endonuclease McrA